MLVTYPTAIPSSFLLSKLRFQCSDAPQNMYLGRSEAVLASPFPFASNTPVLGMTGHREAAEASGKDLLP